ncbi:nitroreductase family protein [Undibacterium sp. TJN19]|uniref:nitroreductase family protein n=1 Tax=Undibacterium sp. TJN19 TaxID=3413055 RepID=UPI003BF2C931
MTWIDLGDPRPRNERQIYQPFNWPTGDSVVLPQPTFSKQSFVDVISTRRSQRVFGAITEQDISKLFWLSSHAISKTPSGFGYDLSYRPVPSAGAIHPLHLLILPVQAKHWQLYNSFTHSLIEIPTGMPASLDAIQEVSSYVQPQNGAIIWIAAEPGKTASKYENANSLIWRDTGALIAQLGLVATYLGLNFCSLGMTGNSWARMLDQHELICGVGVALIGSPTPT